MWRSVFTSLLTFALALCSSGRMASGQYAAPSNGGQVYPSQQYPQAYPQSQSNTPYPPVGPSPDGDLAAENSADEQHGVARLSIVQGDVNMKRADNGELVAAVINAPVMIQDRLETSPGSRAEVELDYANVIRLAPNTELGFSDLAYRRYRLQLAAGTVIYRVIRESNAQVEIDTPSIALRPEGLGEYRISVLEDGTTEISVRAGQTEIFGPHGSELIAAGRSILVRGNPADPELQPTYDPPRDQFDDWSATRDRELLASQSYRYVSPDIDGAEDLDANGSWVPSQYGEAWEPRVSAADWSPYSDGQWAWQPYYGWTWVDAEPWGWAPYHYGRWFWNGSHRWCWWPGGVGPRHLWSPALVGFFGFGTGVGVGFGGVGWVAPAPFEHFHPWWGRSGYSDYRRPGVGTWRGGNIAGLYRNAAFRGGAIAASYDRFGGFRQHFSAATRVQMDGASLLRGQVPVSPTRASYRFSSRQPTPNPRLAYVENRQSFARQTGGIQGAFASPRSNSGGWTRLGTARQAQGVPPNFQGSYRPGSVYQAPSTRSAPSSGWQRFGDPGRSSATRQSFAGGREDSGWHRFGEVRQSTPAYDRSNNEATPSYSRPAYRQPQYGADSSRYQPRSFGASPSAAPRSAYSGYNSFGRGRSNYSAPRSNTPAPQYHSQSPSYRGGGGGSRAGGGGRSSSGGRHGR